MTCNFCGEKGHLERFCKSYLEERDALRKRKQNAPKGKATFSKDKVTTETALKTSEVKDNSQYNEDLIVDSGATVHMTSAQNILNESREAQNTNISTANGASIPAASEGSSIVKFGKDRPPIKLNRILYVPQICEDLLSVSQICDAGYRVTFDDN